MDTGQANAAPARLSKHCSVSGPGVRVRLDLVRLSYCIFRSAVYVPRQASAYSPERCICGRIGPCKVGLYMKEY